MPLLIVEENEIVNRVTQSSLTTLDLEEYFPTELPAVIDLKSLLYQELILREKDLRDFVKTHHWESYREKNVAVFCSADAIIPTWAYMLITVALEPYARMIHFGNEASLLSELFHEAMGKIDWEKFRDAKVVIKGCSKVTVPESAYVEAVAQLRPRAASIFYGEACSTVPLYKKPK